MTCVSFLNSLTKSKVFMASVSRALICKSLSLRRPSFYCLKVAAWDLTRCARSLLVIYRSKEKSQFRLWCFPQQYHVAITVGSAICNNDRAVCLPRNFFLVSLFRVLPPQLISSLCIFKHHYPILIIFLFLVSLLRPLYFIFIFKFFR